LVLAAPGCCLRPLPAVNSFSRTLCRIPFTQFSRSWRCQRAASTYSAASGLRMSPSLSVQSSYGTSGRGTRRSTRSGTSNCLVILISGCSGPKKSELGSRSKRFANDHRRSASTPCIDAKVGLNRPSFCSHIDRLFALAYKDFARSRFQSYSIR